MAWLNAVPKPPAGSRREKNGVANTLSRRELMKKSGATVHMPEVDAQHFVGWLVELGLSEAAGMGVVALSWREIDAWCVRTRIDLAPWEARMMRALSVAYVAESRKAEDETCPAPWRGEVEVDREAEVRRLRMVLG